MIKPQESEPSRKLFLFLANAGLDVATMELEVVNSKKKIVKKYFKGEVGLVNISKSMEKFWIIVSNTNI